jgi:hypothetical protein
MFAHWMICFSPRGVQRSQVLPDEGLTTKQDTIQLLMQDMKDAKDIKDSGG